MNSSSSLLMRPAGSSAMVRGRGRGAGSRRAVSGNGGTLHVRRFTIYLMTDVFSNLAHEFLNHVLLDNNIGNLTHVLDLFSLCLIDFHYISCYLLIRNTP